MYIPKNRSELYIIMSRYIAYAPDFSNDEFAQTQERAEGRLYAAIDNVFSGDPEVHARMKDAADTAFLACRERRTNDALDSFKIIIDELS